MQLENLTINELARLCSEETSKFLRQSTSDDCFCLELFRRAILDQDDEAWIAIYQQYAPLVLTWITQHPRSAMLMGQDGSHSLINAVFAKFAQALTPEKVKNFEVLAALLKYLKLCVHSVIADEARIQQVYQYEDTLDALVQEPMGDDPADTVVSALSTQHIWQVILEELHSEDERAAFYFAYVQGMKPGEIQREHPELFTSVADVYRVKRNVLERLRRNRRLQTFFHL